MKLQRSLLNTFVDLELILLSLFARKKSLVLAKSICLKKQSAYTGNEESLHVFVSLQEEFSVFYCTALPQFLHIRCKAKKLIATVGQLVLPLTAVDSQQ